MCATCGCGETDGPRVSTPGHEHHHHHSHEHAHGHGHDHSQSHSHSHEHSHDHSHERVETITLEQKVLAKNDLIALENRHWLRAHGIVAVNLMSSPGAGKTTLLEKTIREFRAERPVAVIEGDQETLLDADRIAATGAPVVQVNTGAGCHLDASMLRSALDELEPADGTLLLIENVGNLVCPALFDLGEQLRVVIISTTEGSDKPLKYPHIFAAADLVIVNKTDLLPYVDFDIEKCSAYARSVNPDVRIIALSAWTGEGMEQWRTELNALSLETTG
ncbi:hydrogenase nickel incorporation protein HypB [Lolliginicoccus suaedae]|uniref:hydrogenase nickel incorporation protein HypB n=1 Tax=Lolliginicoccus suaedae TaxID=2605429 RepID=UPI0011EE047C|nr:hydrogenase nickel incorporation protein HypB [Lolliginicoccus suaedae]